jgi:tRNA dimethylallyltransferase
VGGSGLYVKALTHGLNELPTADAALRAELEALALPELVAELQRLDPVSAAMLNLANPRHIQRAVEICRLTGKPASSLKNAWKAQIPMCGVFLNPPRESLYARINARSAAMLENGALEEVGAIFAWSATASKTIGVSLIQEHLRSQTPLEAVSENLSKITRNYAKRQITWFRQESCFQPASDAAQALQIFSQMLT